MTASFTRLLTDRPHLRLMSAHSPLSARLAAEAGFDGIWASGFELSALYGLPDSSLISMTQHLDMTRAMAERAAIPVLADLDTGFGNALNVHHAVSAYERAGAGGVVIEDKTFPKSTSLLAGARQELVRVEEFVGKIEAARDARTREDFTLVARTEALIAGLGLDEALRRAHAYDAAGADLVLVHSKAATPDEVLAFARAWTGRAPIALVPTAYPSFGTEELKAHPNIRMVIYGNHAIRASVAAMQDAFADILADGRALEVEGRIATVKEIFRLQGMDEAQRIESDFLR
jgi:phosphoenolpyruvate phosphomutase